MTLCLRLALLGCVLATPAAATPLEAALTCTSFGRELADAIQADGSKVAFPNNFKVAFQEPGNPFVRYQFSSVEGLHGYLNCLKSDSFRNIYIEAPMDGRSNRENRRRIERVKALGSAALCATEQWQPHVCDQAIAALFQESYAAFADAKRHHRAAPRGDHYGHFPFGVQVDVSLNPASFLIIVHSPRPSV